MIELIFLILSTNGGEQPKPAPAHEWVLTVQWTLKNGVNLLRQEVRGFSDSGSCNEEGKKREEKLKAEPATDSVWIQCNQQ